jgi:phospholipid/cholesterol/gamma-HCH transport system substrate-binding protein
MKPGLTERAVSLGDRADSLMRGAQLMFNQRTADDLHTTLTAMRRTLNVITTSVPGPSAEATRSLATMRRLAERLDSTLAKADLPRSLRRVDSLTGSATVLSDRLVKTSAQMDSLLSSINQGRGSLGKLATDSGLYTDMRATSQSLKALIDELQKHPGKITVQVKMF